MSGDTTGDGDRVAADASEPRPYSASRRTRREHKRVVFHGTERFDADGVKLEPGDMRTEQQREALRRQVVENTRNLHRAVNTDVEQVSARKQSIISNQSALEATEIGYQVGTRNIVDVLDAQRQLYNSVRDYNNSRYDYILDNLRLKQAAGTLNPGDLEALSHYLKADYNPDKDFLPPDLAKAAAEQQQDLADAKAAADKIATGQREAAAAAEVPLITFVGNHGIIQIQTGTVKHVSRQRGWLNIFDQKHNGFTLHVDDSKIAATWLLLRPTRDGIVSCLECLDALGHTVLTVFGQRVEGEAELQGWREVLQAATGKTIYDEVMA